MSYLALRTLHVIAMLLWLGAGLSVPFVADIRRTRALGKEHAAGLGARLKTTTLIVVPAALITMLTGVALIMARGGFGAVPRRFHVGLALALLIFVVGGAFTSPAMKTLVGALERDDKEAADAAARKVTLGLRIEDALRFATLFAMLIPFETL